MKRLLVIAFCVAGALVFTAGVFAGSACNTANMAFEDIDTVTMEEARKIALEKVPGEIEDEYADENDDGDVIGYVFSIRKEDGKLFEVSVDAADGKITNVEEIDEEEEDEDPPADETN